VEDNSTDNSKSANDNCTNKMGYSNSYDNTAEDSRNDNISRYNIKSANEKCSKRYGQHQQ